jgi:hypothetical protein
MAGMPIKIRCYQCNQLLGVSRSKAGKAVNCPKCGTGLVVPDAGEVPAAAVGPAGAEATPAFLAALDAGVPVEIADIRPEDIRAQSDDNWRPPPIAVDAPRPAAPPPTPGAPAPELPSFLASLAPTSEAGRPAGYDIGSYPTPLVAPAPAPAVAPTPAPAPAQAPTSVAAEAVVPPIRLEPPSLVSDRTTTLRSRDIVLPRSVVASWSLLVLLAQALAFVAGLLAGHYVWRVH